MKKTAFQVIEKAIKNSSMTITNIMSNTDRLIDLTASDGAGLTINVEYGFLDCDDEMVLCITDEGNDENFASMHPTMGNMRSLSACMRMGMDNIIENAEA
jgi:hypothetical protein